MATILPDSLFRDLFIHLTVQGMRSRGMRLVNVRESVPARVVIAKWELFPDVPDASPESVSTGGAKGAGSRSSQSETIRLYLVCLQNV